MVQSAGDPSSPRLNANQVRALHAAASAVGRLLGEIEAVSRPGDSPFRRYVDDLTPSQKEVLLAFARSAYVRMTGMLAQLGVPSPAASGSARAAANNALTFADVTLQEVDPARLRGYGALSAEAAEAVERVLADMTAMLNGVRDFLRESPESGLAERIARLDDRVADKGELVRIERAIREHGLVSLRRALQALVEQVESGAYEIAVFGRVSSGKSSLLNAILEQDVLPVGVTPVTAVPTRLVWGAPPALFVRVGGGGEEQTFPTGALMDFVTEERNPGNAKGVTRATVRLGAARLRDGIVLVDTPGLNALASSGAREAYAYMPRCDLAVVVVDGSGALEGQDIDVSRTLIESGIEVEMVVTKADRASEADRTAFAVYVREQLRTRLGIDLRVSWVSSVEPHAALARAWFDQILAPRIAHLRDLSGHSLRRKLNALTALVDRASQGRQGGGDTKANDMVERIAAEAARYLDGRRRALDGAVPPPRDLTLHVLRSAAATLAGAPAQGTQDVVRATLLGYVDREREQLRLVLLEARDQLRLWTDDVSRAAGVVSDPDAITVDLTGMPTLDVPAELLHLDIKPPSRLLPSRERRIAEELTKCAGAAMESALRRFEDEVRTWAHSSFARLANQFASQIEPLRGELRPAHLIDATSSSAKLP